MARIIKIALTTIHKENAEKVSATINSHTMCVALVNFIHEIPRHYELTVACDEDYKPEDFIQLGRLIGIWDTN
jgi:hypothetical protein